MPVSVMCKHCGKPFDKKADKVRRSAHHFCSHRCHYAWARRTVSLTCDQCGKPFERSAHEARRRKNNFCTYDCSRKFLQRRVSTACEQCGLPVQKTLRQKSVTKHDFCSYACRATWQSAHYRIHAVCLNCGKPVSKKLSQAKRNPLHFCNATCYHAWYTGSNTAPWRGGLSRQPYPVGFNNRLKRAIRERDEHTCQICGATRDEQGRNLDVHHIDYDKDNLDPANLIGTCLRCNLRCNHNRDFWRRKLQRHQRERGIRKLRPMRAQYLTRVSSDIE